MIFRNLIRVVHFFLQRGRRIGGLQQEQLLLFEKKVICDAQDSTAQDIISS
jgi:hypothetical protein